MDYADAFNLVSAVATRNNPDIEHTQVIPIHTKYKYAVNHHLSAEHPETSHPFFRGHITHISSRDCSGTYYGTFDVDADLGVTMTAAFFTEGYFFVARMTGRFLDDESRILPTELFPYFALVMLRGAYYAPTRYWLFDSANPVHQHTHLPIAFLNSAEVTVEYIPSSQVRIKEDAVFGLTFIVEEAETEPPRCDSELLQGLLNDSFLVSNQHVSSFTAEIVGTGRVHYDLHVYNNEHITAKLTIENLLLKTSAMVTLHGRMSSTGVEKELVVAVEVDRHRAHNAKYVLHFNLHTSGELKESSLTNVAEIISQAVAATCWDPCVHTPARLNMLNAHITAIPAFAYNSAYAYATQCLPVTSFELVKETRDED